MAFKQAKNDKNPISSCWDIVLQRFDNEFLKDVVVVEELMSTVVSQQWLVDYQWNLGNCSK